MSSTQISAGVLRWLVDAAVGAYGLTRAELLDVAQLDERALADASSMVSPQLLTDLLRYVLAHSGDPGFGLRCAREVDLRTQGFYGYALLSSTTLRERIERHVRYQSLRGGFGITFTVAGDAAWLDISAPQFPPDVLPTLLDWSVASTMLQLRRQVGAVDVQLWLQYPEQPHHRALRSLVNGPVVFAAPCNRLQLPAAVLDRRLDGDSHLGELAVAQLDQQLKESAELASREVVAQVRARVLMRLESDVSLAAIARDLHTSARTLQRQLGARGVSFQELLEEVRHERAITLLSETGDPIESIALRLGYGDASNFRRAFRRWTGTSPGTFRTSLLRPTARSHAYAYAPTLARTSAEHPQPSTTASHDE